nr:MAG TPA: hypothetical protein [Caudoviricetes sp.]
MARLSACHGLHNPTICDIMNISSQWGLILYPKEYTWKTTSPQSS